MSEKTDYEGIASGTNQPQARETVRSANQSKRAEAVTDAGDRCDGHGASDYHAVREVAILLDRESVEAVFIPTRVTPDSEWRFEAAREEAESHELRLIRVRACVIDGIQPVHDAIFAPFERDAIARAPRDIAGLLALGDEDLRFLGAALRITDDGDPPFDDLPLEAMAQRLVDEPTVLDDPRSGA